MDDLLTLKSRMVEFLGDAQFSLIEVERLRTGYLQLMNVIDFEDDKIDLTKVVKDAKITHLSTWMIIKDPALKQALQPVASSDILPISVKVRHFGNENVVKVYNNSPLDDLIQRISLMTELEAKQLMIKIVEDTMIRRIDRKVYNQDNPNIKNTLKDLKIIDNSALLVELKDPAELLQESVQGDDGEVITINKESAPSKDEEMIDIDSTENIRTVIVNMDSDKNTFDRYQINIDWTLQELTDYILKEKQLEPPYKLRNLTTQRLFVKEELDTKMRSYQDF